MEGDRPRAQRTSLLSAHSVPLRSAPCGRFVVTGAQQSAGRPPSLSEAVLPTPRRPSEESTLVRCPCGSPALVFVRDGPHPRPLCAPQPLGVQSCEAGLWGSVYAVGAHGNGGLPFSRRSAAAENT